MNLSHIVPIISKVFHKNLTCTLIKKCNYSSKSDKNVLLKVTDRKIASHNSEIEVPDYLELKNDWPEDESRKFVQDMKVIPDFITEEQEHEFMKELEPYLKRMRYEFDHWDDAIHGFRETERKNWYPNNKEVLNRVRELAFNGETLPYIHVLDLAKDGVIKPHVDSTRYCGSTIAGISLLSDAVMRLVRTDKKKYVQKGNSMDDYRSQPHVDMSNKNFYANILIRKRSLYVMKDSARYNFTHEILANEYSSFKDVCVEKNRRVSIICRNEV